MKILISTFNDLINAVQKYFKILFALTFAFGMNVISQTKTPFTVRNVFVTKSE